MDRDEVDIAACPYCGSKKFKMEVGRKMEAEEVWEYDGRNYRVESSEPSTVVWEAVYGISCADCGEDLSGEVGL